MDHLRVLGPFTGVTAAGLRTALAQLHAADPWHPAVCVLDRAGNRWLSLSAREFAERSAGLVVSVPDPGGDEDAAADAVARYLVDLPLGDRPLVFAHCRGFVGAKMSHVLGDGRITNAVLPRLIGAAAGQPAPAAPAVSPTRLPLASALVRQFGRRPDRLLDLFPVARPPAAPPGERAWRPDPAYVSTRSGRALGEIRAWRDAHLPRVSVAAIQFAVLAAAFREVGLPVAGSGAVFLVDARRYLRPGRPVPGNFVWGLYLRPGDLTDPAAVHRTLATELRGGSVLAMLALRAGRLLLAPGRAAAPPPAPTTVAADPRPRLTLTHIGRLDAYRDLPWTGVPGQWRTISVPTTSGPESVTASFAELSGVAHLNVSFHRSTFDPGRVREAVELACAHPVDLLPAAKSPIRVRWAASAARRQ